MHRATLQDRLSPESIQQPHAAECSAVISQLQTDRSRGLSTVEAKRRLERLGKNELQAEAELPAWRKFLTHFNDALVILLLVATAVSTLIWLIEGEDPLPYEALVILAIVILNAVIGFIQKSRARSAVEALRKMVPSEVAVIRDAAVTRIPAVEVVPGDILALEEGGAIAADGRVTSSAALHAAEAALSGESVPVQKQISPVPENTALGDRSNMVFKGTVVTYGRGQAVVTATGMQTEMGGIARLLSSTEDTRTPLQLELDHIGKLLGIVVVAIAIGIIAMVLLMKEIQGIADLLEVLILGVALAVAAVPEGLPAVVTAALSLGVQRMAKQNAIVRNLAAVETLGSATVIASDKTGTLTRNEMTACLLVTASGRVTLTGSGHSLQGEDTGENAELLDNAAGPEIERLLVAAERANNASVREDNGGWSVQGDPTEGALLVAARKGGIEHRRLESHLPRIGEIPFSSERKRMSSVHSDQSNPGELLICSKGAPDVLLDRCSHELVIDEQKPLSAERRAEILQINDTLAGDAFRTLAIAERRVPEEGIHPEQLDAEDIEQQLTFLGLIGLIDPPREEAGAAVNRALAAGIRPIMVTGDHPRTALRIATDLGITSNDQVITGAQLENLSDELFREAVRHCSVFARVKPEHKLRIVDALQQNKNVVAMTGDGVNDAPALKKADIGIAMGITGTDVSRQAADVVLTDDNFATIISAVEQGRAIFDNITKFLRFLLSSNTGEVATMFFGVLFARQLGLYSQEDSLMLPLLATHILWINLVTDGLPALALGVDPAAPDIMMRAPRDPGKGILTKTAWLEIVTIGCIMAAGTLLVLDFSLPGGVFRGSGDIRYGQTMAFTTLVLFQLCNALNMRSPLKSALPGLFRNYWLWVAIAISLVLHFAVLYVPALSRALFTSPLTLADWSVCLVVASSLIWLREAGLFVIRATTCWKR